MIRVVFCLLILLAAPRVHADALPLGDAAGFNVFTLKGQNLNNTTIHGRVFSGGDIRYDNTVVGKSLGDPYSNRDNLIVGGNMTARLSAALRGNARYSGTATLDSFQTPHGSYYNAPSSINTSAAGNFLRESGVAWQHLQTTGTTTHLPWGTTILGGQKNGLNVFSLNSNELSSSTALRIAVPADSTVLINVRGGSVVMQNFSFDLVGVLASKVIINFVDAASVTIRSMLLQGTVFAPNSDVILDKATVVGQIIASTLSGNGTIFDQPFTGSLPPVNLVPIPRAVSIGAAGLLCAFIGVRAKQRRSA